MSDTIVVTSGKITLSREEYDTLCEAVDFLNCLQAAGVDNWEGYSEAQEMMGD